MCMKVASNKYQFLSSERQGHLAVITFQREDKLNALSEEMTVELHRALDEVAEEFPGTRVLILTGAGRGFCSGADVGRLIQRANDDSASPKSERPETPVSSIMLLASHLRRIPQPVVAAVNGVAAGAGLSLALCSDVRIASEDARFSAIFVKRSLVPDTAASYTIAALAGQGVAAEMCLTGRVYDARWALEKGLVNKVVPAGDLMAEAETLADEIASNPPIAVRSTKALLYANGPAGIF